MRGKKTGGRVAGTPNKVNANLKAVFAQILNDYYGSEKFKTDFECLSERDRVAAAEKLAAYLLPKSVESNVTMNGGGITIEDRLARLAGGEVLPKEEE